MGVKDSASLGLADVREHRDTRTAAMNPPRLLSVKSFVVV
jgi:hypothetical protein